MSKTLVTGGAGFIGSNLVNALVAQGHGVMVLDNLSTGKKSNLSQVKREISFVKGDIRERKLVSKLMKGVDYVFHQAALPSVARSVKDPVATNDHNVSGLLNVLVAAVECKVRRVIFASSSSVYGDSQQLPKDESMPANPLSPYAITKYVGELYCRNFYHLYGLETVALRYFNVFGPRQSPHSDYAAVIPTFITSMLKGKAPIIYGDGLQTRDFTYVDNVVTANLLAATAKKERVAGQSFNVGCGTRVSLLELVEHLQEITGTKAQPIFKDQRQGDIQHSLADLTRVRQDLGYTPSVPFREGLISTVNWLRAQHS